MSRGYNISGLPPMQFYTVEELPEAQRLLKPVIDALLAPGFTFDTARTTPVTPEQLAGLEKLLGTVVHAHLDPPLMNELRKTFGAIVVETPDFSSRLGALEGYASIAHLRAKHGV